MTEQKEQVKAEIIAKIKATTNPVIKAELEKKLKDLDKIIIK